MIPAHWQPYRRSADAELLGYLATDAAGTVPMSLLGLPLAEPGEPTAAAAVLEARGLAVLSEVWWLRVGDEEIEVRILEAGPDRIRVVEAPYGYPGPQSARYTLEPPTMELSPRR